MKSVVVYESMYGNTHRTAQAIADGLGEIGEVVLGSVSEISAADLADVDLVVVGGPTHVHGMSKPSTRKAAVEAAEQDEHLAAEDNAAGPGVREWIDGMPKAAARMSAAFDTRVNKPVLITGSAAKGIAKRLKSRQVRPVCDPESFFVEASEGPLEAGELDRARAWGADLAGRCRTG